ncbi:MAG: PQQ-binding-like beta-propeller repeat protein [Planctomycetales bacterium]
MPYLEIRRRSGQVETRELSKQAPLLVGSHPPSDIRVEAAGVAPVHCRISWNRRQFEVAAVTALGVQCNGSTVQQATLSIGDVLRVGDVDIALRATAEEPSLPVPPTIPTPPATAPPRSSAIPANSSALVLKSITDDDLPVRSFQFSDTARTPAPPPQTETKREEPPHKGMSRVVQDDLAAARLEQHLEVLARDEPLGAALEPLVRSGRSQTSGNAGLAETAARLKQKWQSQQRRPGEQEVLRSPLVIALGTGTLLLLLTAATIWFVLSREAAQREFDAATNLMQSGQYTQAIEGFERFVRERPGHALLPEARLGIDKARMEQLIGGGAPVWDAGLAALDEFITQHRDSEAFQDDQSPIRRFTVETADRIAGGAVEAARVQRKRPLLAVSAQAVKLLELFSPPDKPPTERLGEIARITQAAEAAVLLQETIDAVVQNLDDALARNRPLSSLSEYRRLLERYPAAADDKTLRDRLKKCFQMERTQTVRDEERREALREERTPPQGAGLMLARRNRIRSDVSSTGDMVFAQAADALVGVDAATGEPLWRRVIGLDPPFFPVRIAAGAPALLCFDGRASELLLVQQRSGDLMWRLPLDDRPQGTPLVQEGQILVPTAGGQLVQIDIQSGAAIGRLRFSQPLVGPPLVSESGERLYLVGQAHVLYVLSRRPLGCEQVVWLGHGPGGIDAPPLVLRSYLLLAENDRAGSSRVRVFDATNETQPPQPIAQHRLAGTVHDAPAVRGKQLVIPSTPDRISAFTVAETGDRQALAFVADYEVKTSHGGATYVAVGPDDQLWMSGSALRRFTISRDSLLPDKQELAIGIATQPLQMLGDTLFVGRRPEYSRGVLFAGADRVRMATQWQLSLGGAVLECTAPASDGATVCLTSLGELYQVTAQKLARGGFELQTLAQLPLPEGVKEPLAAARLADGRIAVASAGTEPRLWIAGNDSNPREYKLPKPLETHPVLLGPGLLLPLPGGLRLMSRTADQPIAEELPAPSSDAAPPSWRSVVALDETQALALNSAGRLSRIQYRSARPAHLAEITHWQAAAPVDQPLLYAQGRVLVADATGKLVLLEGGTFEPQGARQLPQPARRPPWNWGDQVFVESADGRLHCFGLADGLPDQWELPLDEGSLVDPPLGQGGRLFLALDDGRLLVVDAASGKVEQSLDLGQRLSFGPRLLGNQVVVGTLDGSLLSINSRIEPGR